jgi:AcrR family transcriptional regulator
VPAKDRARRRAVPRQARARITVDAILIAARAILEDDGYAALTTNRIAERAGVNIALVYRYFAAKESIVAAVIEQVVGETERAFADAVERTRGEDLAHGLRAIVEAMVMNPPPKLHRALVEHVDAAGRRALVDELRERLTRGFLAFLSAHDSELRPFADRAAAMFVLGHALEAATHAIAFYRPAALSAETTIDEAVALVHRYLAR